LEDRFRTAENAAIIAFIEREHPSAHDDVASVLIESAKGLPDVQWYCPDVHRYAYVVLHTRSHRIFGIAFSMSGLAYRFPPGTIPEAVAAGGKVSAEIGDEWVLVQPWQPGAPRTATQERLKRWCKIAHDYAVGSTAAGRR
jgi:hypothetical protein